MRSYQERADVLLDKVMGELPPLVAEMTGELLKEGVNEGAVERVLAGVPLDSREAAAVMLVLALGAAVDNEIRVQLIVENVAAAGYPLLAACAVAAADHFVNEEGA